jgi:hypothetical protein
MSQRCWSIVSWGETYLEEKRAWGEVSFLFEYKWVFLKKKFSNLGDQKILADLKRILCPPCSIHNERSLSITIIYFIIISNFNYFCNVCTFLYSIFLYNIAKSLKIWKENLTPIQLLNMLYVAYIVWLWKRYRISILVLPILGTSHVLLWYLNPPA